MSDDPTNQTTTFFDFGGPIYSLQRGKIGWRFEMHKVCGPVVVDHKGEPKKTQPPERSGFWKAVTRWAQQGQRVTPQGVCIWEDASNG